MLRYVTAVLLVLSTVAHARGPNPPAVGDAREPSAPLIRDSKFQDAYLSNFVRSCLQSHQARKTKVLSETLIRELCDCGARESAELLNERDAVLMAGAKKMPKTIEHKLDQVLDVCVKRLISSDKP